MFKTFWRFNDLELWDLEGRVGVDYISHNYRNGYRDMFGNDIDWRWRLVYVEG